jgi:hypothetical protein
LSLPELGVVAEDGLDCGVGDGPDCGVTASVDAVDEGGVERELLGIGFEAEVAAASDYVVRVGKCEEGEEEEGVEIHFWGCVGCWVG